jgi:hypothetical protein
VSTPIRADVMDEAVRLLAAATAAGITVRLIGGTAIRLHAGTRVELFAREIRDIDLVAGRGHGRRVAEFLESQAYAPNRTFNAMHGARRLLFYDEPNGRQVDVFIHTFEMCHVLPLGEYLEHTTHTVALADLLLTKLQIVALNEKDRHDSYVLLLEHEVGAGSEELIDAGRIADLCARDWGLYRTTQINLERLLSGLSASGLSEADQRLAAGRIGEIVTAIDATPKSVRWRARARVGDRVRWYEEPDEVDRGRY